MFLTFRLSFAVDILACRHFWLLFEKLGIFSSRLVTLLCSEKFLYDWPGKSYWRGGLSTVDLLVLTSLDSLLCFLKILLTFLYKKSFLVEEINCTEPSSQLVFPANRIISNLWCVAKASMAGVTLYQYQRWFCNKMFVNVKAHLYLWNQRLS